MMRFYNLNSKKVAALLAVLVASINNVTFGAVNDSMKVELKEVMVEAEMQQTSPTMSTYIPNKKVKNAAQNVIDLLRLAAIPQIMVDPRGGGVTTIGGQSVAIFINYMPATSEDINGMRMADVRRIEYLDFPTDPRFRNAEHVVNIIVQQYEYGGYSKISASQYVMGAETTQGAIFSKFAYKKFTYDFYAGFDRVDSKHVNQSNYSSFRLPDGTINRNQQPNSSKFAYYNLPVTLRLTYGTQKMQLRNTIGYSFMNRYKNVQMGQLTFTPDIDADYNYCQSSPYRNSSLTWYGNYYFALSSKWQLTVDPQIAYSHNDSYSDYSTTMVDASEIINNAKENAYKLRLDAKIAKQIGQHSVNLSVNAGSHINDIDYWGSNPFHTKFSNSFVGTTLGYAISLRKVYLNVDGGISGEFQRTNGYNYDDWYPFAHLSATYAWNQKIRLNYGGSTLQALLTHR